MANDPLTEALPPRLLHRLREMFSHRRGEAELRALDARELRDLGLDAGSIAYAARHGRNEQPPD